MASELESALPPITTVGRQPVNYGHPPSARFVLNFWNKYGECIYIMIFFKCISDVWEI